MNKKIIPYTAAEGEKDRRKIVDRDEQGEKKEKNEMSDAFGEDEKLYVPLMPFTWRRCAGHCSRRTWGASAFLG